MFRKLLPVAPLLAMTGGCEGMGLFDSQIDSVNVLLLELPALTARDETIPARTLAQVFIGQASLWGGGQGISGARVRLRMPDGTAVDLEETSEGSYQADSITSPSLYFEERALYQVVVERDGETTRASARTFVETSVLEPAAGAIIEPGSDLPVHLADGGSGAAVMVWDEAGELVYDGLPSGGVELLEVALGEGADDHIVPGSCLATDGLYLVGAGALDRATWQDVSGNLDEAVSAFVSGSMDAVAVSTEPLTVLAGMVANVDGGGLEAFGISFPGETIARLYGLRFLADRGLEEDPMSGARPSLTWSGGSIGLQESDETPGLYRADSQGTPGLGYQEGSTYTFSVSVWEEAHQLSLQSPPPPPPPALEPGSYHPPTEDLVLEAPWEHDRYLALLVNGHGEVVYSDLPEGEEAVGLGAELPGVEPGETIRIPSRYLHPQDGPYAVGFLGLNAMDTEDIPAELNPRYSGLYVGSSSFTVVLTSTW